MCAFGTVPWRIVSLRWSVAVPSPDCGCGDWGGEVASDFVVWWLKHLPSVHLDLVHLIKKALFAIIHKNRYRDRIGCNNENNIFMCYFTYWMYELRANAAVTLSSQRILACWAKIPESDRIHKYAHLRVYSTRGGRNVVAGARRCTERMECVARKPI